MSRLDFNELSQGAAAEKLNKAFDEVLQNMQDPNTEAKTKRIITVKLSFSQNDKRTESIVDVDVSTKLAADSGIRTRFEMFKDLQTGEIYTEEYQPLSARQLELSDQIPVTEDGEILDGEPTEVPEKLMKFRKVN